APAPDDLVDDLTKIYCASDGDLAEMLLAIAAHDAFWSSEDPRLAQPLEFALRLTRSCDYRNPWAVRDYLNRSGAGLFDRSTPDGYPEDDAAFTDSNALVQRWRLAQGCAWNLSRLVPDAWRSGAPGASDSSLHQRAIDALAMRLTGQLLGKRSNEAALQFMADTEGSLDQRILAVAPLIAQLPEANIR
ncbi:MAG: DUF1800 family protein, partial [Myxococcales bacterium]|nr:DUF1800 family protein [Myxococcales bacterium]